MSEKDGQEKDVGLIAMKVAFDDAKYLCPEAKQCAELMMIGAHRKLEIPDNIAMEMYSMVTEDHNFTLDRRNDEGDGYVVNIESYANLRDFFAGNLDAAQVSAEVAANDG